MHTLTYSISDLADTHHYSYTPTSLLESLTEDLGPKLSAIWMYLYNASLYTDSKLSASYSFLASKFGCSTRSIISYLRTLSNNNYLIVNKTITPDGLHGINQYELKLPTHIIDRIKQSPSRKRPDLYDNSVDEPIYQPIKEELQEAYELSGNVEQPLTTNSYPQIPLEEEGGGYANFAYISSTPDLELNNNQSSVADAPEDMAVVTNRNNSIPNHSGYRGKDLHQAEVHYRYIVDEKVIKKVHWIIKCYKLASNPSQLAKEALFAIACNFTGKGQWHCLGTFKRLLTSNRWRTPYQLKKPEYLKPKSIPMEETMSEAYKDIGGGMITQADIDEIYKEPVRKVKKKKFEQYEYKPIPHINESILPIHKKEEFIETAADRAAGETQLEKIRRMMGLKSKC